MNTEREVRVQDMGSVHLLERMRCTSAMLLIQVSTPSNSTSTTCTLTHPLQPPVTWTTFTYPLRCLDASNVCLICAGIHLRAQVPPQSPVC